MGNPASRIIPFREVVDHLVRRITIQSCCYRYRLQALQAAGGAQCYSLRGDRSLAQAAQARPRSPTDAQLARAGGSKCALGEVARVVPGNRDAPPERRICAGPFGTTTVCNGSRVPVRKTGRMTGTDLFLSPWPIAPNDSSGRKLLSFRPRFSMNLRPKAS